MSDPKSSTDVRAMWGDLPTAGLEIRQWLPEHLASPSEEGWLEAFTKLDATLAA